MSESKKSNRGGKREGAGRKPTSVETIAKQVDRGKVAYVRADRALGVRVAFEELLHNYGATNDKLAQRIAEGLDAQQTRFFQKDGICTDSRDTIAWSERREYAELVCRVKQVIPKESKYDDDGKEPLQVVIKVLGQADIVVNG